MVDYPTVMSYWTSGYTQATFDGINIDHMEDGSSTGFVMQAHTYGGWFLGGGVEAELPSLTREVGSLVPISLRGLWQRHTANYR